MFTNYTNQIIYNYLQSHTTSFMGSKRNYQELISSITSKGLNKKADEEDLKKTKELLSNTIMFNYQDFSSHLFLANSYLRAIQQEDGSFNIYPSINSPTYTDMIIDYCITNNISIIDAVEYYDKFIQTVVAKKSEQLNNSVVNEYRGDLNYIATRCKAIYDAVAQIASRTDLSKEEMLASRESLDIIKKSLNEILAIIDPSLTMEDIDNNRKIYPPMFNNYKLEIEEYDRINELYDQVIKEEEKLIPISKKIWTDFTVANNSCLVHKLTCGITHSDNMNKICTSYYSDNVKRIVEYCGNTGYIYPIDLDFIMSMHTTDAGSWQCDKKEFIRRGFPSSWQLTKTNIWYEEPYHTKLFTPEYVEQQLENKNFFAEIIIDNNKRKIKPLSCFYTENATETDIAAITRCAMEQGLETILLDTEQKKKTIS